jgi:hypothetical protein
MVKRPKRLKRSKRLKKAPKKALKKAKASLLRYRASTIKTKRRMSLTRSKNNKKK